MAYFVKLKMGTIDVWVNMEKVTHIQDAGARCTLYFSKEHSVHVYSSPLEVLDAAKNGYKIPED